MKTRYTLPLRGIEAEIEWEKDKDGNLVAFTVIPLFYSPRQTQTQLIGRTVNSAGELIQSFMVRTAGKTGKTTVFDVTTPVQPAIYTRADDKDDDDEEAEE